jgi:hypothetical protein
MNSKMQNQESPEQFSELASQDLELQQKQYITLLCGFGIS